MPGSGPNVMFDPFPTPLSDYAVPILVCRFDRARPAGQRYVNLPNVYCLGIQTREGPDPGSARFAYVFNDADLTLPYPTQFEQVWPVTAEGDWVVTNDMEIVVLGLTSSGAVRVLFHGFALIPQVDLGPDTQSVTFLAAGVASRAWDTPIGGAIYRNADDPDSTATNDQVQTDWPVRFNPSGLRATIEPNCTPDDHDIGTTATGYPVFLDDNLLRDPDPREYWTVGKAVRYILGVHNPQDGDPVWVKNPDFTNIDTVLNARTPADEDEFYDPADSTTYSSSDIILRDYDCANRAWPDVVAELAGFAGAVIRFELTQDSNDEPVTTLRCRRGDATSVAPRDVYLDNPNILDVTRNNVGELHVARDAMQIANEFIIETDPVRREVSIVLAPGFTITAGDEGESNRKAFLASNLSQLDSADRSKYRSYVADEAGDGHWDYGTSAFVEGSGKALNLDLIFGPPSQEGEPKYARRLRKPERTLFSKDGAGLPLKATLSFSRDYTGAAPAVWDPADTSHWQPIPGGWQLLQDRIGIYVNIDNPEQWEIGEYRGSDKQNPTARLRGIISQSNPDMSGAADKQGTQRFYLRLTCVIPGDTMIDAKALKRDASPTEFARTRRIDAKDHFREEVIDKCSQFNTTGDDIKSRDDTEKAQAHAQSLRAAHEFPPLEGAVTMPWIVNAYKIGDRIRKIAGREVPFQSNAGTNSGEAPRFPYVTEIDYDFSGDRQTTTLHYSDRRLEPQRA